MSFITKNNILNDVQHGFFEGKSTETATHAFHENIQKALEKDTSYWNFLCSSKAYDVLVHKTRPINATGNSMLK